MPVYRLSTVVSRAGHCRAAFIVARTLTLSRRRLPRAPSWTDRRRRERTNVLSCVPGGCSRQEFIRGNNGDLIKWGGSKSDWAAVRANKQTNKQTSPEQKNHTGNAKLTAPKRRSGLHGGPCQIHQSRRTGDPLHINLIN